MTHSRRICEQRAAQVAPARRVFVVSADAGGGGVIHGRALAGECVAFIASSSAAFDGLVASLAERPAWAGDL
jgi:hypothetical protein